MSGSRAHIYQIFYSEETRAELDPGFIPLDNVSNERPDWREYWPIRKFLLNNTLDPDDHYGFFSPKFGLKTRLKADAVQAFVAQAGNSDAVLFSPFPDFSAFYFSVFEQAHASHPGFLEGCQEFLRAVDLNVDLKEIINDSTNTVFCNYFVAKATFWAKWLELTEKLFAVCEQAGSPLGQKLRANVSYGSDAVPLKVFVMERIASLVLSLHPELRTTAYCPYGMIWSGISTLEISQRELLYCDALKMAYRRQRYPQFLDEYLAVRTAILAKLPPDG
jgi:hypothetical protein